MFQTGHLTSTFIRSILYKLQAPPFSIATKLWLSRCRRHSFVFVDKSHICSVLCAKFVMPCRIFIHRNEALEEIQRLEKEAEMFETSCP